jgi:hypothetical protein
MGDFMERSHTGQVLAVGLAGAIALAYVQVSSVPTRPAPPQPSVGQVVNRVKSDVDWIRTQVPRDPHFWKSTVSSSSQNFKLLRMGLTEGSLDSSGR